MWISLTDKYTEYLLNLDFFECIRKGVLCDNGPTIIFYSNNKEDIILEYKDEESRDLAYQEIKRVI
jgi:hypothetical protein